MEHCQGHLVWSTVRATWYGALSGPRGMQRCQGHLVWSTVRATWYGALSGPLGMEHCQGHLVCSTATWYAALSLGLQHCHLVCSTVKISPYGKRWFCQQLAINESGWLSCCV
jgi:hypothetical protein